MKNTANWQRDVVHIILYVVGVVLFVVSVPELARSVISAVVGQSEETLQEYYVHNRWVSLTAPALGVAAGLLLARVSGSLAGRAFPDRAEVSPDEARETSPV